MSRLSDVGVTQDKQPWCWSASAPGTFAAQPRWVTPFRRQWPVGRRYGDRTLARPRAIKTVAVGRVPYMVVVDDLRRMHLRVKWIFRVGPRAVRLCPCTQASLDDRCAPHAADERAASIRDAFELGYLGQPGGPAWAGSGRGNQGKSQFRVGRSQTHSQGRRSSRARCRPIARTLMQRFEKGGVRWRSCLTCPPTGSRARAPVGPGSAA